MNDKYKIQLREFLKLLCVGGFALLYALGGIEFKWIRRFIAPVWLGGSMFLFYRDWKVFLQTPLLMISLSFGYGGTDQVWLKIWKRGVFGLVNGATALVHRKWKLGLIHLCLCVGVCIAFGVWNPFGSARAEEMGIGFIIGWLPMFMGKEKENA